jgi:ribosomal protein S18 acetylase RimI-like enzyme
VGRQLLDQALNAALGAGFRRVELEVYASNMAAVSLYQSRGFAVEGVKRAMRVLDGRVDDVVLMARPTTDGPPEVLSNTRVVGESSSWKVTL